jgi:U3 small nucleolar RNA-associated protein MPP10
MSSRKKQALRLKMKKSSAKMRARLDGSVDKFARMKNGGGVRSGTNVDGTKGKKGKMGREKEEKAAALKSVVKSGKGVTVVGKGSGKEKK